ncbi:N-acetylmuramidase domain-containing protein [Fulvimarina sp. MAC3]|uniref:N-acetylmuramidase domain-containing protein n=1 Tax=Fulvimarina sp. MAC3 TaxID=3148887 RepID=UPI0031FCE31C
MGIEKRVIEAARQTADETGVGPDVLLAVALVETRAVPFAEIKGRPEPLIRFEGHYFDRRLSDAARTLARGEGLSSPRAGRIMNPVGQAARWELFERASRIDGEAACASVSWGLCQVMGSHGEALGYQSAEALAAAARRSIAGQFEVAARFLRIGALCDRLSNGDYAGFARRYNGPGYRRNGYDTKIAAAYRRACAALEALDHKTGPLAIGARGRAVLQLQEALRSAGSAIRVDGLFGSRTAAALAAWQVAAGLAPTGVVDERTGKMLRL